jgi:hypothetical protein
MPTETKDILSVNSGVIVHPVSCGGKMSGGFSHQVLKKFPTVLKDYVESTCSGSLFDRLGKASLVNISEDLSIANVYCLMSSNDQNKFEYMAFKQALVHLTDLLPSSKFYFPYKLGCGLQGGNWKEIEKIIHSIVPKYTICILPAKKH